eukprot:gene1149-676_t
MSQHEELLQTLISIITDPALCKGKKVDTELVSFLCNELHYLLWFKLPQGAQGPVLATAACLPLWEALNFVTSSICQIDHTTRAFLVVAVTSLYPKYRDKRCVSQHFCTYGSESTSVPLTTSTSSLIGECIASPSAKGARTPLDRAIDACSCLMRAGKLATEALKGPFLESLRDLLKMIPLCSIECSNESGEVLISLREWRCSLSAFRKTVWTFIALTEVHGWCEGKEMDAVLTESQWAARVTQVCDEQRSYGSFFAHSFEIIRLLLSVGSPAVDVPVDNWPLLDYRIVKHLVTQPAQITVNRSLWWKRVPLRGVVKNSEKEKKVEELNEMCENIKMSVEMDGNSSRCRTPDELTLLCRDVVFKDRRSAFKSSRHESLSKLTRKLLFHRQGCKVKYPASFLPEEDTGLMMEPTKDHQENMLEQIIASSL